MSSAETTTPRKRYKVRPLEGEELAIAQTALDEWHEQFNTPEHRIRLQRAGIALRILEFVHHWLEENNKAQIWLAERMGVSESTVSRILSGEHNFTIETIAKIELALGEDFILTPLTALQNERVRKALLPQPLPTEG